MRKRFFAIVMAAVVATATAMVSWPAATASPSDSYAGPYFGENNFPPGCTRSYSTTDLANCHRMRLVPNGLDSPQVDVVVMVPVSPTAERDMRMMRQSVEMWEAGIDYIAQQTGLTWLADGMDFHITVEYFDPLGNEGGEFTTYPIVDPEIVVIMSNPVGGVGIGIDPVAFLTDEEAEAPCHTVENPFDFEYWSNLPGFNSHHDGRTGTYNEDCGGAGGNICFAINGAIDPAPETLDVFSMFDLVAHEFGHCLTLGHVGDGAEGKWGNLAPNDIMAYSQDPPGLHKCVSTLDVEGVALRMSRYLDVNGDGGVDANDLLLANDQIGEGGNPFQVQHPHDHQYASATGSPLDCPQPDQGFVPGKRTDWTPTPVATTKPVLDVTGPEDGTTSADGIVHVTGTVEHESLATGPADPTEPTGFFDDADNDATSPITEIKSLGVEVTPTHVNATMSLAEIWPSTTVASPVSYSLAIDGKRFDSFVRYPVDGGPILWNGAGYMPADAVTWDLEAKTVNFHIGRDFLTTAKIDAPYFVSSQSGYGTLLAISADDKAPESGETIGVSTASVIDVGIPTVASGSGQSRTVTLERPEGNTFYPWESTGGLMETLGIESGHRFNLELPESSDVVVDLTWTDIGGSDLDLYSSDARMGSSGAFPDDHSEQLDLKAVKGNLALRVDPFLVTDAVNGATYTLTATITPSPDSDGDGVVDDDDRCPAVAATGPNGCVAPPATEHVRVYVDGVLAGSQDVDTSYGRDAFDIAVNLTQGTHDLRVEWEDNGSVVASQVIGATSAAPSGSSSSSTGSSSSGTSTSSTSNTSNSGVPSAPVVVRRQLTLV